MIRIIPPASCLCVYLKSKQVNFYSCDKGVKVRRCRTCFLMDLSHATSETGNGAKQKSYGKTVTCRGNTWLSGDLLPECFPNGICKSAHEDRPTDTPILLSLTTPQEARVSSNYISLFSQKSILSSFVILPLVEFHRIGYIWGHWQMLNYILMPWGKNIPLRRKQQKARKSCHICRNAYSTRGCCQIFCLVFVFSWDREYTVLSPSYRKQRWLLPNK